MDLRPTVGTIANRGKRGRYGGRGEAHYDGAGATWPLAT
jgi:hypothetical protein